MIKNNVFRKNLVTNEIDNGAVDSVFETENLRGNIILDHPYIELASNDIQILQYNLLKQKKEAKQVLSDKVDEFLGDKITIGNLSWKIDSESQFNILSAINDFDAVLEEQKALGYIPADSTKIAWSSTGLVSKDDLIAIKNEVRRRKSIILGKVKLQLEGQIDAAQTSDDVNKIVEKLDLSKFL